MGERVGVWHGVETERLPGLVDVAGVRHGFVPRVRGLDLGGLGKSEAVERLRPAWVERLAVEEGVPVERLWTAEQVHGNAVAVVPVGADGIGGGGAGIVAREVAGVDGLATGGRGIFLGILVADCCAVYLVDRVGRRGCALVHAGRRGTESGIVPAAVGLLGERFGIPAGDLRVGLSPCVRPPHYEVDFAGEIRRQCVAAGVSAGEVFDAGVCTGERVDRYYSYRRERGRTGRMLAFLGIEEVAG